MAGLDIVANGLASITGTIAKASIFIKDERAAWDDKIPEIKDSVKPEISLADSLAEKGAKINGKAPSSAFGSLSSLKSLVDSATGDAFELNKSKKLYEAMKQGYNKVFEVQFNPDSLEISGTDYGAGLNIDYSNLKNDEKSKNGFNLTLSTKLIFVKEDLSDAFPTDMVSLSTTQAARSIIKAGKKLFGSEKPSVQIMVEGFIGALRNVNTRKVAFDWGPMFYEGILKNVNASYTLFDASGRPVRAEVQFSIYLIDPEIGVKDNEWRMGYWQLKYEKAFSSSSSYIGLAQKLMRKVTGG